jgi:hypothetical protein
MERAGRKEYFAKKAFGEIAKLCLNVIARRPGDEAIHSSLAAFAAMDCFARARNDGVSLLGIFTRRPGEGRDP